jgi:polyhydroxybutyrate depolymerase
VAGLFGASLIAIGLSDSLDLAAQAGRQGRLRPGDSELTLQHAGRRRSYLVHVPRQAASNRPLPLVIAFHGGGGNASGFKRDYGFDRLADREGFIVVYPNGTGPLRQLLLTFNSGNNCCGPAREQNVDDVGFAAAIVEDVAGRTGIDRSRVYATGHSNGSMMAYRLAAERADLVAAVAGVAGAMSLDRFAPARAVPILHIHSIDDPRALYAGGSGPPFPGTDHVVEHDPVQATLDLWARRNGCASRPQSMARRGPDSNGHTAERLTYAPCEDGNLVEHWRLTGAGHGWPGGGTRLRERLSGPATNVIDATDEVWSFVSKFRR